MEHTPIEIQIRGKRKEAKEVFLVKNRAGDLNDLIRELYSIKNRIRDFTAHRHGSRKHVLAERKEEIIMELREQLVRVSRTKARQIKARLFKDLGILIP